jgi:hypothetical protein
MALIINADSWCCPVGKKGVFLEKDKQHLKILLFTYNE